MAVDSGLHKNSTGVNVHVAYSFEYADAAAREAAAGLVADDEGKFARQLDDDTIWMLTDYTGPTWVSLGNPLALLTDGTRTMAADLDMDNNSIINLADPSNAQDAATKSYVDANAGSGSPALNVYLYNNFK